MARHVSNTPGKKLQLAGDTISCSPTQLGSPRLQHDRQQTCQSCRSPWLDALKTVLHIISLHAVLSPDAGQDILQGFHPRSNTFSAVTKQPEMQIGHSYRAEAHTGFPPLLPLQLKLASCHFLREAELYLVKTFLHHARGARRNQNRILHRLLAVSV
jgi:hypothetical protein